MKSYLHITRIAILSAFVAARIVALEIPPEIKLPPPPNINKINLGVGLNVTQSDTDSSEGHLTLEINGSKGFNEWMVEMFGAYGKVDGKQSVGKSNGSFQFNRLMSGRAYYSLKSTAEHDSIRDLKYRMQISPGLGYYVIKNPKNSLALESGFMYRSEEEAHARNDEWGGRFAERYTYTFKPKSRFWFNAEITPEHNLRDYILIAETGVETPLTKDLSIRLVMRDIYDNAVEENVGQNEFILRASLVWSVLK